MREPATETSLEVALGAMLGACVGDAAGAVLEFLRAEPTPADVERALGFPGGGCWRVAPGQITDDGELTVTLAVALAEQPGIGEHVARAYAGWYASRPFDMGQTTARAFGVRAADRALAMVLLRIAPHALRLPTTRAKPEHQKTRHRPRIPPRREGPTVPQTRQLVSTVDGDRHLHDGVQFRREATGDGRRRLSINSPARPRKSSDCKLQSVGSDLWRLAQGPRAGRRGSHQRLAHYRLRLARSA
jgi:hypothetical protein